ncbi:LacI family DNA-binding transcriptional regulator [Streptacidiphilus sp. PAMC 29251]
MARVAGVSVSTVSRVFTAPQRFRDETRQKVYAAAEQLNYAPNRMAAALTTGRTGNIGLIVPNLANPLFPEMVKAAQHQSRRHNLAALLGDSDDDADDEEKLIRTLSKDVDGFLLFSSLLRDEQIAAVGVLCPTVFVNRRVDGYPCVLVDALQGMRQLTQYLSNLGHTSLFYLAGPANSWAANDRVAALVQAGTETGLQIDVSPANRPTFESGTLAAEQLVRAPLPTAVVCFNDVMAMGLTASLLRSGVRVPEQISVVGWGGTQLASYTTPAVTTMAVPLGELGSLAVDQLLLDRGCPTNQDPGPVSLGVSLVARATTGRARVS